ncbi:MAG: diguanylate cyclase domain-containing protein [Halanaerobiaceae bacterium]
MYKFKDNSFIKNSRDGIYRSTPDGKFIDVNQALVKILGYDSKEELLSKNIPRDLYLNARDRPNSEERNKIFETRLQKKDNEVIWVEINSWVVKNKKGDILYYEGVVRNITNRKKNEEKIKYIGYHDELTGLYNRHYLEESLKRLDSRRQLPLSIIGGDVNGLKLINDAFGHTIGDNLLKTISKILKNCCRQEDIIARWGGDEFVILLPQTTNQEAKKICKRINGFCQDCEENLFQISIALGYATKTKPEQDIEKILKKAEKKVYKNKLVESKKIKSSIINSLEKTLLKKKYETKNHAERLKKLVVKLGKKIDLSRQKIDNLILLAGLHDIGKIAISENILTKNDKLTQKEWQIMKKHPEIGYRIAQTSSELSPIAEGILYHHEWWNGSGYPQGLKKEEIPLISRIIALVDAYDVMLRKRPYKKSINKKEAIKEIKRGAGQQFDPVLVEKFLKIIT